MLALSVRQPFAELILQGIKTCEYRSRPTRMIGQRFNLYASRGGGDWRKRAAGTATAGVAKAWSLDLAMPGAAEAQLPWLAELANALRLFPDELPTGLIVGSAVIEKVSPVPGIMMFAWHLADVRREATPRKPRGHPQPVWWRDN